MRMWTMIGMALLIPATWAGQAFGHCQVPCGIYDDSARVVQLREHTKTIQKAVKQIAQLAAKGDPQSRNQLVRWITTKEAHAEKIIRTISDYFLAQKIKPVAPDAEGFADYLAKIGDHHLVLVAAMKAKQSADPEVVATLRAALDRLGSHYDLEHKH